MKKLSLIVALLVMTATFAVAKEKVMTIRGKVTSVDPAAYTLMVKEKKGKELTLNVSEKTKIMAGKEKKGLADLKAGDWIMARAVKKGDKTVAESIRISTPKPANAKAAPKKEENY
jgi:Cu/Ag efflux protein CusF